jgi:hypothetical protein
MTRFSTIFEKYLRNVEGLYPNERAKKQGPKIANTTMYVMEKSSGSTPCMLGMVQDISSENGSITRLGPLLLSHPVPCATNRDTRTSAARTAASPASAHYFSPTP